MVLENTPKRTSKEVSDLLYLVAIEDDTLKRETKRKLFGRTCFIGVSLSLLKVIFIFTLEAFS